jgi:hypothetical protein
VLVRLALADEDASLADALDRWELALFQSDPFRGQQLRDAFAAVLGETWPLRAAILLEDEPDGRERLHGELAGLAAEGDVTPACADAARRALVEVLRHGDRIALQRELDRALLGSRDATGLRLVS